MWLSFAGADLNPLPNIPKRLNELSRPKRLLEFKGNEMLRDLADKKLKTKTSASRHAAPDLQKLIEADNKIRTMVTPNETYKELESVAYWQGWHHFPRASERWAGRTFGLPPRWLFHPLFFPSGCQRTRVDVYVPYAEAVQMNNEKKVTTSTNS